MVVALVAVASVVLLVQDRATPTATPHAVFIGDSYTHGTGASSPELRWSTLVAKDRGWNEINLANGGTGYLTTAGLNGCGKASCPAYLDVVPQAVADRPDIVVVAGGQNDFTAYAAQPEPVVAAIDRTYRTLRADLPDAEIIAVGPSTAGAVNPTVRAMDEAVRAAAAAVDARYISLIDPEPVIQPDMVVADRAHVNDAGHAAIAGRVIAGLAR